MALPSSGNLTFSQIQAEFGAGTNLRAFLKGGSYVDSYDTAPNVPSSGDITIRNFLGAAKVLSPLTPTVNANSGATRRNAYPTITGTGRAGETIAIYNSGTGTGIASSTTVDGSGNWSITQTSGANQSWFIIAKASNARGTTGESASSFDYVLDTVAPSAPSITAPSGSYSANYNVQVTPPEADCIVRLYKADGTYVGTTGYVSAATNIASGAADPSDTTYYAIAEDRAGNVGSACATSANFHAGAVALDAGTGSPTSISGLRVGTGTYYSDYCTASPTGGTPGYTYSWSKVSGATQISIDGAPRTAATCRAIVTASTYAVYTATFRCTVTDSVSATDSFDISVTMERTT